MVATISRKKTLCLSYRYAWMSEHKPNPQYNGLESAINTWGVLITFRILVGKVNQL